jgi:pimeloyl-ACP methyl ester carboxylesterase
MVAEGHLALPGGRAVAWCEWGEPGGHPVVLLHGTPGSRFFLADPAGGSSAGLRVLTFDRPGYGLSTPPVVLTLSGVVEIVERLADDRGLDRFPVIGFSGGAPYALACGAMLGSRVTRVAAVSGGGPIDELPEMYASLTGAERDLLTEIRDNPAGATQRLWDLASWYADTPLRMLDTPQEEPDAHVLDHPEIRSNFVKSNLEAARQGQAGLVADWIAEALPWGFALADISTPVDIWVGERDPARAPLDAPQIARRIPRSSVHADPESGHWLLMTHWRQIIEAIFSRPLSEVTPPGDICEF